MVPSTIGAAMAAPPRAVPGVEEVVWAYMVQTRPGLPSWQSLPGVGVSVPTFLAEGGGSSPQPVGS